MKDFLASTGFMQENCMNSLQNDTSLKLPVTIEKQTDIEISNE